MFGVWLGGDFLVARAGLAGVVGREFGSWLGGRFSGFGFRGNLRGWRCGFGGEFLAIGFGGEFLAAGFSGAPRRSLEGTRLFGIGLVTFGAQFAECLSRGDEAEEELFAEFEFGQVKGSAFGEGDGLDGLEG